MVTNAFHIYHVYLSDRIVEISLCVVDNVYGLGEDNGMNHAQSWLQWQGLCNFVRWSGNV